MHDLYTAFRNRLDKEDRQGCLDLSMEWLREDRIGIAAFYEEVLTPSLREEINHATAQRVSIWEEHLRSSIVRTIVECCYPLVIKESEHMTNVVSRGNAIIFCPIEEYHEIGARMATDFFILCGFDAMFVGANTPPSDIIGAIESVRPVCVAISISNYYNLVAARKTLDEIRELRVGQGLDFKIAAGGVAFIDHPERCRETGADLLMQTYRDVEKFAQDFK
jgi:methanogenic corrinoid protein MtbC1